MSGQIKLNGTSWICRRLSNSLPYIGALNDGGSSSDRICGIRFTVDNRDSCVSYWSCLDHGMDIFREHLVELEHVISESELLGPVVVADDFNAHLGKLGGSRGAGDVNVQGVLIYEMMGRCNLSAVSVGSIRPWLYLSE